MMPICLMACNTVPEPKTAVDREALVKQYFQHFNNHDWNKMAAMYKDSALFKDPTLGDDIVPQSRQQIVDKYSQLNTLISDVHDSVIQTYLSGANNIIVEFVSTGTLPNKAKIRVPICTIFTFENGLITKDFTYFNNGE